VEILLLMKQKEISAIHVLQKYLVTTHPLHPNKKPKKYSNNLLYKKPILTAFAL